MAAKRNLWTPDDDRFLRLVQENNTHVLSASSDTHQSIPKLMHFIWLGRKPLPRSAEFCIKSFQSLHPHWTCKVWLDGDVDTLQSFPNSDLFQRSLNFGMKSDLLRYEILRQFGGVYADIDYEFVRSLDPICAVSSFFCGLSNTGTCEVNNGIIGSVPSHPLLDRINGEVRENIFSSQSAEKLRIIKNEVIYSFLSQKEREQIDVVLHEKTSANTIKLTGPGMLTALLDKYLAAHASPEERSHAGLLVVPVEVFSPVPNLSQVFLDRLDDSVLQATPPVELEQLEPVLLLDCDYSAGLSRDPAAAAEVNWRDYFALRAQFVEPSPFVVAVHWWQRSWQ